MALTWKFHRCQLAFIVLEGAMMTNFTSYQSYSYSNYWPGKIHLLVQ